jgi:hypothetical protein
MGERADDRRSWGPTAGAVAGYGAVPGSSGFGFAGRRRARFGAGDGASVDSVEVATPPSPTVGSGSVEGEGAAGSTMGWSAADSELVSVSDGEDDSNVAGGGGGGGGGSERTVATGGDAGDADAAGAFGEIGGPCGWVGIGTNSPGRQVWGWRRIAGSFRKRSACPHARQMRVPRASSPRDRSARLPPPRLPVLSSLAQTKSDAPQFEQMGATGATRSGISTDH